MIKVQVFNSTGAASKLGEMNEFGVITLNDGEIMHLSKIHGSVKEYKEPITPVSPPRSEPAKKLKKKG